MSSFMLDFQQFICSFSLFFSLYSILSVTFPAFLSYLFNGFYFAWKKVFCKNCKKIPVAFLFQWWFCCFIPWDCISWNTPALFLLKKNKWKNCVTRLAKISNWEGVHTMCITFGTRLHLKAKCIQIKLLY